MQRSAARDLAKLSEACDMSSGGAPVDMSVIRCPPTFECRLGPFGGKKAALKVKFCREAVLSEDRFDKNLALDDDLGSGIGWISARTPVQAGHVC